MVREDIENRLKGVVQKIIEKREDKGYSLDNMATEMGLSVSAYNKIERMQTKLTLQRLFQIQIILDAPLQDLLGVKNDTIYHQKIEGSAVGYQAGVQHLYQENKELSENFIKNLQDEIAFLRGIIEKEDA